MKERPILMTGESIRAILEGRKTQTRRVIAPQPTTDLNAVYLREYDLWQWADVASRKRCPYGQPGDLLWVRETWRVEYHTDCDEWFIGYRATDTNGSCLLVPDEHVDWARWQPFEKWRPSIHMPKWATRLWLRVTDVRVERLQDISEEDAKAEGCELVGWTEKMPWPAGFAGLWDSINARRGYGWESNPWVWSISFERFRHKEADA